MSLVLAPFGLRPAFHPSGSIRNDNGTIASAYNANIFNGSPVTFTTDGTLILAAAGSRALGAFQGVEYNSATDGGRRVVSNYWPANTVATSIKAYMTSDPEIVYAIQANAAITQASLGHMYDWSTNASANGSTSTGNSTVSLDVATVVTAGSAGLQVVGLVEGPGNAWNDGVDTDGTYPIVLVKIAEPVFGASYNTI
jgi:hypothetical protein